MNAHGSMVTQWCEATPPDVTMQGSRRNTGRLCACHYCGSMHPADLAAALQAGATASWADFKYGWPHKAYVENIPNPHAGMLEVRCWSSHPSESTPREVREPRYDERTGQQVADYVSYTEEPRPAKATTGGKFYTVHLQEATPEERAVIEQALGLCFTFHDDGKVSWTKWTPRTAPAEPTP